MPKINPALLAFVFGAVGTPCFAQTIEEKLRGCDSCHGELGIPKDKNTPVIWGQVQGYIDNQLSDFKAGRRVSEQMAASVRDLDRFDIVAISEHYSQKEWPDLQQPTAPPEVAQRAEQLVAQRQCTASGCHVGFMGGIFAPRLAGQFQEYLTTNIKAFQSKMRRFNLMEEAVDPLTDADIEALSRYLAGL